MTLKDKAEIQSLVNDARGAQGFAAADDDAADNVAACCAGVAAMYSDVAAIPIGTIIALALQLITIIFPDGGSAIENLKAIIALIQQLFVTT